MRYFSIYIPDPKTNDGPLTGSRQEEMNKFVEESAKRGEFLSGGGFLPITKTGAVLRRVGGTTSVIDGPYAESKELLGGFAMLEYPSREAAIEGARRFLQVAGDGECVTYQLTDGHPPQ
jgi:hypothetical protein